MDKYEFIKKIKVTVRESSSDSMKQMLHAPSGRKPTEELVIASRWYNLLSDKEKDIVNSIIGMSIDNAIFGFLCVLDGVRVIESNEQRGSIRLSYIRNNEEIVLNEFGDDYFLHEIYNIRESENKVQ